MPLADLAEGACLSMLCFLGWLLLWKVVGLAALWLSIMWIGSGGTSDWTLFTGERTLDDCARGLIWGAPAANCGTPSLPPFCFLSLSSPALWERFVPSREVIGRFDAD